MRIALLASSIVLAALVSSCAHQGGMSDVAMSADEVHPVLVGAKVPAATLRSPTGEPVELNEILEAKPTVLVFYRGGWCPYCNRQLKGLADVAKQLEGLGYQLIAVSPDRPAKLQITETQDSLNYQLLSDSKLKLAKAMGLVFQVDAMTLEKYKKYKIDLDDATGESHHQLPVPAVFLVETDGTIVYEYVNPNYKVRLSGPVLLAAAKAARGK